MTSKTSLHRIIFILRWIKGDRVLSFDELLTRYRREMYSKFPDEPDRAEDFSRRTLQRDVIELRDVYGIYILYDRRQNGYRLSDKTYSAKILEYLLDTLELYQIMQLKPLSDSILFPDDRKARGSEHMMFLLKAITGFHKVEFEYHKFDGEPPSLRQVNPLALKEFKNRWYLLAFQDGNPKVKSFGLDRMQGIRRLPAKFDPDLAENWTTQFESVFGITSRDPKEAVKVVLSFRPVQGRYVQALPLHQSQTTILENENEIRISLRIAITHDFIMELLSYGAEAEVISPRRLRSQIARLLNDGSKRYEKPQ